MQLQVDVGADIQFAPAQLAQPDSAGKPQTWLPRYTDYAYFTLLSSNNFGSPEGHLLVGLGLKRLQLIHTLFMSFLFLIVVARAINTLA